MSRLRRALLADVADAVREDVASLVGTGRCPRGLLSPVTAVGDGHLRRLRVTLSRGDHVLSAVSVSEDARTEDAVSVVARLHAAPGFPGSGGAHVDLYASPTALSDFARTVSGQFRRAATATDHSLPSTEHLGRVLDAVASSPSRLPPSVERLVRADAEPSGEDLAAVEAVLAGAPLEWALRRLAGSR